MRRFPRCPGLQNHGLFLLFSLTLFAAPGCGGGGGGGGDEDGDGYSVDDGDCDDARADVYPGADEKCDGIDNNCDGNFDVYYQYYSDSDGDGYGDPSGMTEACSAPSGYVEDNTDCDDSDGNVYPTAIESCNEADDNCNNQVDEGAQVVSYPDEDGDGYGPVAEAVSACEAQSGYVLEGGDCDDTDPALNPGATEICDSKDNNCDGIADDGTDILYFNDADGDGFGSNEGAIATCGAPDGYIEVAGDCDDSNAEIYPGATDADGDGTDQDCGGSDGQQPSVGLDASTYSRIQDALDAASEGDTVFVGPGDYRESNVTLSGKSLTLFGTHGAYATTLSGGGRNTPMVFNSGEGSSSVVSRLALSNGNGDQGGSLSIIGASPTLDQVIVQNSYGQYGAGVYLEDADPILTRVKIRRNTGLTGGKGAGIYMIDSDPTLTDCRLVENIQAQGYGGGLYLENSNPTLTRVTIQGNNAAGYNVTGKSLGGGIYMINSTPTLLNTAVVGNRASGSGAGLYIAYSSPAITNCTIAANRSGLHGAGIYMVSGDSSTSAPTINNSIIALNSGENVYNDPDHPGAPVISYSLVYHRNSSLNTNMDGSLGTEVLEANPEFQTFINNGDATDDDYHLVATSPALDSGDPSLQDPDGSSSDMGAFGGPDAEWAYYADDDGDGMYDGWERDHELDPKSADGSTDDDGDGLTNAAEYDTHTDPQNADTDGDGANDGAEDSAGSDPTDWYSQTGTPAATAYVPSDFETVQAALDAILFEGKVEVAEGLYEEVLEIENKALEITGAGQGLAVFSGSDTGPTFTAIWSEVQMSGFTVADGLAIDFGGGMHLRGVSGQVRDVRFTANNSSTGGGLHMAAVGDDLLIQHCIFDANDVTIKGSGISMDQASPRLDNLQVYDNVAGSGDDENDEGSGSAAGLYMSSSSPTVTNCAFTHNSVGIQSGSSPTFTNCTFEDSFFGMDVYASSPTVEQCTFTGNDTAIRVDEDDSTVLTVTNSILAFSNDANLFQEDSSDLTASAGSPESTMRSSSTEATDSATLNITYSDLYQPSSCSFPCVNYNVLGLSSTNMEVDPLFQASDGEGLPTDLHLSTSSSLLDAGKSSSSADPDGTTAAMGAFGGSLADAWDLDNDGVPNYFWAGAITDTPGGFSAADYDCDDLDPTTQSCP